jgi:hypothetical protein
VTTPILSPAEYAWQRQSVWSKTADQLKAASQWRWRLRMILTVAAAALALAGSQLKPVNSLASIILGAVAAAALAGAGLLRIQQDAEQTRRWTRARSVSEAIKADVYTFLAQSGDGQLEDREAKLEEDVRRLETDADDLSSYTHDVEAEPRSLPAVTDVDTYLAERVRNSQLEKYYGPKSRELRTRLRWTKAVEITLTLAAAALATLAAVSANAAAWAAVVTTAVGAVTAYVASERYEFLWIEYTRTAEELRRLLERRTTADGKPLSGMALVAECEQVISVQNEAWMAKWGEKNSGKKKKKE